VKLSVGCYKWVEGRNQQDLRSVFFCFIRESFEFDRLCFCTVVHVFEFASKEEFQNACLLVAPPVCSLVLRLNVFVAQHARPVDVSVDYRM